MSGWSLWSALSATSTSLGPPPLSLIHLSPNMITLRVELCKVEKTRHVLGIKGLVQASSQFTNQASAWHTLPPGEDFLLLSLLPNSSSNPPLSTPSALAQIKQDFFKMSDVSPLRSPFLRFCCLSTLFV